MAGKEGKRYRANLEKIPSGRVSVAEAVGVLKGLEAGKFDPTVELVMHLGIDPRQAEQQIRGSMSLPHGIGKSRKVIAFCEGEDVDKAAEAGAIEAGSDDLIKKIQGGWMDFDVAVATPAMMKSVSRLGRVLGPQGKMPSPKAGTVTDDVAAVVKEFAAGKGEYRNDEGGNIHAVVGKMSFDAEQLVENIDTFVAHIRRLNPPSAKGTYMKKVCLCATMSPSIELDLQ